MKELEEVEKRCEDAVEIQCWVKWKKSTGKKWKKSIKNKRKKSTTKKALQRQKKSAVKKHKKSTMKKQKKGLGGSVKRSRNKVGKRKGPFFTLPPSYLDYLILTHPPSYFYYYNSFHAFHWPL
jgi:hypothetical protein